MAEFKFKPDVGMSQIKRTGREANPMLLLELAQDDIALSLRMHWEHTEFIAVLHFAIWIFI